MYGQKNPQRDKFMPAVSSNISGTMTSSITGGGGNTSTVTWAPDEKWELQDPCISKNRFSRLQKNDTAAMQEQQQMQTEQQQGSSEIDRIMAKIEQARYSLANVCVLK